MDMVTLGHTGLEVSVACLGTGGKSEVGKKHGASFEHSVNVVKAALDEGINFIDTAYGYSTEEIVGAAIKGRRDEVVISTKNHVVRRGSDFLGTDFITGQEYKSLLEENLRRLGTDHVDILHLHAVVAVQYDYCVKELLPAMIELRDEGKTRFIAISERFNVDTNHDMLNLAVRDPYWDVMMVGFNFVNQLALRHVIPEAKKHGTGTMGIYAVRGQLSKFENANRLVRDLIATGEVDAADIDDPENPLGFLITEGGASSLTNAAYRFNRHAPGADVVVTGTGNIDHLKENVRTINEGPLPQPVLDRLERIFGRVVSASAD